MLPVQSRLRRGSDIREVSRRGARRSRAGLAVSVLLDPENPPARATVVVNKKVGGAVVRNRLRRQVRHSLLRVWGDVPSGARIVVRAQGAAGQLGGTELDETLQGVIRSAVSSSRVTR